MNGSSQRGAKTMSQIETKLLEVTGTKKKAKETRQEFLNRLVGVVQKRCDDADDGDAFWDSLMDDSLGDAVQLWINEGIKAINAEREAAEAEGRKERLVELEEFPDVVTATQEEDVKTEEEDAPAPKAAKEPKAKAAKAPKKEAKA